MARSAHAAAPPDSWRHSYHVVFQSRDGEQSFWKALVSAARSRLSCCSPLAHLQTSPLKRSRQNAVAAFVS